MSNRTGKSSPKTGRRSLCACLSLFVMLAIGIGFFGDLIHHHSDLYSKRFCTICLNTPHMNGEVTEGFQGLPRPAVSFSIVETVVDLHGFARIASNAIRAPPAV